MATDGPDPTPCDDDLFQNGVIAALYATEGACSFERCIVEVRERTGGKAVDWHYFGGVAQVKCWPASRQEIADTLKEVVAACPEKHQLVG